MNHFSLAVVEYRTQIIISLKNELISGIDTTKLLQQIIAEIRQRYNMYVCVLGA